MTHTLPYCGIELGNWFSMFCNDSIMNHLINRFSMIMINALNLQYNLQFKINTDIVYTLNQNSRWFICFACCICKRKFRKNGLESNRLITMAKCFEMRCVSWCVYCVCHFLRSCWSFLAIWIPCQRQLHIKSRFISFTKRNQWHFDRFFASLCIIFLFLWFSLSLS